VFFFCSDDPGKGDHRLSACLETAPPVAPSYPPSGARAARLTKFEREQLIVGYLNRGVSVAEIAARVGVGEKRMRAVIRDPRTGIRRLAHRCPHPPEAFVAIQVSRLNEALLIAFSAMTGANLKAVDRVVKIVRELDRGELNLAAGARPGNPAQRLENVESAPGNPLAPRSPGQELGEGGGRGLG
jgi:transposase